MDMLPNEHEDEKPLKKRKLDRPFSIYRYPRDTPTPATHESDSDSGTEQSFYAVTADSQTFEPHPIRHPSLWFQDGSLIVVASDGLTFKLHEGILSRHSEVLKDLISTLPSSDGSVYRERTLQLPERGDELADFFEVLYDGGGHSYYNQDYVIQFDTLRRLLLVSIKYKVSHIVDSGISRLKTLYPSDYDNWTEWVHAAEPETGNVDIRCTDSIAVVEIARAAGCTELLPVALYSCVMMPWENFLEGEKYGPDTVTLSVEDQKLCLKAQDSFRRMSARINDVLLSEGIHGPRSRCQTKPECRKVYRELGLAASRSNITFHVACFESSVRFIEDIEAKQKKKRCSKCVQYLKKKIEEREREEWQTLGDVFGIPDWPPKSAASSES
ncbi:hypothetical protein BDW22DRAFT_1364588 [Trametopsis cervina]|nr:hypothetical protein BDW22DRAFT_1364588 [Trametopsis cervina]